MIVTINGKTFSFNDKAEVKVNGYDLDIIDPEFDRTTEKQEAGFTSVPISLPSWIRPNKTYLDPCSKIYLDAAGRRRLNAYFD